MAENSEQNRSEAPTTFKLRRAREKGQVARSTELGPFVGLIALVGLFLFGGPWLGQKMADAMRQALAHGIDAASDPQALPQLVTRTAAPLLNAVFLFGGVTMAIVILAEIIQLRGFLFSAEPLKPDFSRLNPAKGLKRIFSMRMLKETLKTVAKTLVYGVVLWLAMRQAVDRYAPTATDSERLAEIGRSAGLRLLVALLLVALLFVGIDQILTRREFLKQMRMSRREVGREARDREGEPRIKRKRQQFHAELVRQTRGMGSLPGSDLLVVNPEHYAVALRYDAETMAAPTLAVKGRNKTALAIKAEAVRLGITIFVQPALARALFKSGVIGREVAGEHFEQVAALYTVYFRTREGRREK